MVNLPQLKERVARKLGVLPVGNRLSAEDSRLIGEHASSVQQKLSLLDLAQIDLDDGVDESIVDIIVAMIASTLVDDFMLAEPKRSQIAGEGALGLPTPSVAERQLRKIYATTRPSRPVRITFY